MSDGIEELRAAEQARERHTTLLARLRAAESHHAACAVAVTGAAARVDDEQADVERLTSLSLGRIVASLRGDREARLGQEEAEVQAAEYAHAQTLARLRTAQDEVRRVEAELVALGDVEGQHRAAATLREQALLAAGGDVAERLGVVASETGAAQARVREYDEALAAAGAAGNALAAAAGRLGSAKDWATWDTFGGGGLITDSIKYDRMDEAATRLRDADAALVHLARELSDVQVAPLPGLQVPDLTRALDVWFDNLFSDWAVRDRIRAAGDAVASLRGQLDRLHADLVVSRDKEASRLAELEDERERLRSF